MIAFCWSCRGLTNPRAVPVRRDLIRVSRDVLFHGDFSVHAVGRQANEAAHLTASHFCFSSCPKIYDVIPSLSSQCMFDSVTILVLMIGLFSRSGDG